MAAVLLLWFCAGVNAETFSAKVIAVVDGDTMIVLHEKKRTTLRLEGIDAPEKAQPWGSESRGALTKLVLRKEVHVSPKTVDQYGRVVAIVELGGSSGIPRINVSEAQVRSGMAWEYSRFHADKVLTAWQAEAQRARLGLWRQANPQPPWEFRKAHMDMGTTPQVTTPELNPACGNKRYCSQMVSCEEAMVYFKQCGLQKLDKNGDGVPCENLCNAKVR